ncbi:MAG: bifunctional diaminohydroxyphosphoribosylaminopyrimidine deaminase/5-amino-6-(5-phosphoribosylamino)uracil reductase RibD [Candidatus Diapherotrites archaeon]
MNQKQKKEFMLKAIELAKKGIGRVSPNPLVGCVIVKKTQIVGQGFHEEFGKQHAEIMALKNAKKNKKNPENSIVFVTLEPCPHYGKTPPCVNALIKAKVKKVFIGMKDPCKKVKGKGISKLRKAGIEVEVGLMEKECRELNYGFVCLHETKMPFVALKSAMSLDGKIADFNGKSKWITGKEARKKVHELRNEFDAILVGKGTVDKDNPRLTCRIKKGRDPVKIILDPELKTKLNSCVYSKGRVFVACLKNAGKKNKKMFLKKGKELEKRKKGKIELIELPSLKGKEKAFFSVKKLLVELRKKGINSVLVEGGENVNYSFLKEKIVNRLYLFVAPKIIGGNNSPGFIGGKGFELKKAINLNELKLSVYGKDLMVETDLK